MSNTSRCPTPHTKQLDDSMINLVKPADVSLDSCCERPRGYLRTFGRLPQSRITTVRLTHERDPEKLAKEMNRMCTGDIKPIMYQSMDERPKINNLIFRAVLKPETQENKIFKRNLKRKINKNISETGYDPRIDGPPTHIKCQKVNTMNDDDLVKMLEMQEEVEVRTPIWEKATISSLKKRISAPPGMPLSPSREEIALFSNCNGPKPARGNWEKLTEVEDLN